MSTVKKICVAGSSLIDEAGNKIILHGINMVCKDRRVNHIGDYKAEDFRYIKDLGMNVIRLGIFWESVEPEPGKYDNDYLSQISKIVDLAAKEGIYTYLDMHQDLYGAKYEDGAPDWAVLDEGTEHIRTELWSESYLLSPAVQKAFDNFWDNSPAEDGIGIQDHFIKAWCHVAEFFAGNPYVIGYDFFNEPFPGSEAVKVLPIMGEIMAKLESQTADEADLFAAIKAIEEISGLFEEEKLNPFYERIVTEVRKKDTECLVLLEANYFSNAAVPTHVRPISVNGEVLRNQVYAPHGYDIFVDTDKYEETDNSRVDLIFATHKAVADAMGLPMLVGEWGCYPDANEVQVEQASHLCELFMGMEASDTYFDFSHLKGNKVVSGLIRK